MNRLTHERGQVFVLTALMMSALIGMAALALDVGSWFHTKRRLQATADAAALAGAQALPENPSTASSLALTYANKNAGGVSAADISISSTLYPNDTITVHSAKSQSSVFGRILGIQSKDIAASATAQKGSYSGWALGLVPWAIDRASVVYGQIITFKVQSGDQASPGNFGGVDLQVKEDGCAFETGGNPYYDLIAERIHSCLLTSGDSLPSEPGNKAATGTAVSDRGAKQNFDPNSILTTYANGQTEITDYNNPNVIVIPVIKSFHQGSSAPFTDTGFAWFIITNYTSKTVTGMFVRSGAPQSATCPTASDPNASCPFGAYNPDGFAAVKLIK